MKEINTYITDTYIADKNEEWPHRIIATHNGEMRLLKGRGRRLGVARYGYWHWVSRDNLSPSLNIEQYWIK